MASLPSRCSYKISMTFSFSNSVSIYTQSSPSLLPMYYSTHLFITSWVIIRIHILMQRRPHRLFVSSILEAAIHERFSF